MVCCWMPARETQEASPSSTLTPHPIGNAHHAQGWNQNGFWPTRLPRAALWCRGVTVQSAVSPPGLSQTSRNGSCCSLRWEPPLRGVFVLSLGARLVCGKNRKQEGSCHQLWVVGSSTSPQCFCLLEARDELCSIHLSNSQLGAEDVCWW